MKIYQPEQPRLSQKMHEWLHDRGSFIQRLKRHGQSKVSIQVLLQEWQVPLHDERIILDLEERQAAWVREVLIYSPMKQWMYARTVVPRQTLTGQLRQLASLKNRSLGSVLFKQPHMQRSEFEMLAVQPGDACHVKASQHLDLPERLWGRRSVFSLQQKSLLLLEIFFPDIETL